MPKYVRRATYTYRVKRSRRSKLPMPPGLKVRWVGHPAGLQTPHITHARGWRFRLWRIRYWWAGLLDRLLGEPRA